jgi:pimeloyl-ACP methyl ester carboxylesterase
MSNYHEIAPKNTTREVVRIGEVNITYWKRPSQSQDSNSQTLVLIHGNSASKAAFRQLFEGKELSQFDLYAMDLPGCGESENAANPANDYNMPALANTILGFVNHLALKNYFLLGWSLGGHLCIEMIARGAKPQGLILTGTPPCGPSLAEVGEIFLPAPGAEVTGMVDPTPEQLNQFAATIFAPNSPDAEMLAAARRADGLLRGGIFEYLVGHQDEKPQRQTIAETKVPVALIQGTDEPFFNPKLVDKLSYGNLWRGATQWINGSGHAPFIDKPDEYASLIVEFVDESVS